MLVWESCGGSRREPWASGAEERRKESVHVLSMWSMEVGCTCGDLLGVFGEAKGRAMADPSLSSHWHRMDTSSHRLYPGLLLPPLMDV